MLNQYTIYYDDTCTVCTFYSKLLVRIGILKEQAVVAFSAKADRVEIDARRARYEIALYDHVNRTAIYGFDNIFTVVTAALPAFGPLFRWAPFHWLMAQCYALLTYNRQVIAPPAFFVTLPRIRRHLHLRYRLAYIGLAWLFTSILFGLFFTTLEPVATSGGLGQGLLLGGELVAFQSILLWYIRRDRLLHYLGHLMTVLLIGALMLVPAYLAFHLLFPAPAVALVYYAMVVIAMFTEHCRRMKMLGLDWRVTAGWSAFHVLVFFLILSR